MGEDEASDKKMYTEDQVNRLIHEAQVRQLEVDNMRTYGNMFFAEALDHISTLAKGDKAWKTVLAYGQLFRKQFEENSGQVPKQPKHEAAAPATEKKESQEKTPQDDQDQ